MKISGFENGGKVELHASEDALVMLKQRMTAMELLRAARSLQKLAMDLHVHLARVCGHCDGCDGECPFGGGDEVDLPDYLREEAGIPEKAKLFVSVDEEEHTVTCSTAAFLQEKTLAFSCAHSGLDCCYVGEQEAVFAAMRRLEETVDVLESEAGAQGMFLNDLVMEEILEELRDIGRRDGISCTCGSRAWNLKINYSSVELTCARCGAGLKIPAATMSDIEDLCCKPTLTIRGKEPPAE